MWYEKWLKFLCCAFEAQKEQFQKCEALLKSESWKTVVENEPPELIPLSEGNVSPSPNTTYSPASMGSLSQASIVVDNTPQTATLQEVSLETPLPVPSQGTYDEQVCK